MLSFIIKFRKIIVILMNKIKDDHLDVYSASTAFYMFISIIPFFIGLFSLIPYTPVTTDFVQSITDQLPDNLNIDLVEITAEAYIKNAARLSVAFILAIISSAKGVMYMTKGLNEIYGVNEKRNYFVLRFWATIYTIITLIAMVVLMTLGVFGKYIYGLISAHLFQLPNPVAAILHMSDVIAIAMLSVMFMVIFTVLPNKKLRIRNNLPGAVLAAISWWCFTRVFSWFTSAFGGFSMYGSLATVVASLLWMYFCMYIMFICAELNNYLTFRGAFNRI